TSSTPSRSPPEPAPEMKSPEPRCCRGSGRYQRTRGRAPRVAYLAAFALAASHSALLISRNPLPLQEFWPLQALLALLQADWPLQALTPAQCCLASVPAN